MYGVTTTFQAPVEMYDGMHAEMIKRAGTSVDGLLVHIGHATTNGFEVLEVWESKEHYDRANTDIVIPVMRELAGDQPAFDGASNRSLRRPWAYHPQRQHPDLTERGVSALKHATDGMVAHLMYEGFDTLYRIAGPAPTGQNEARPAHPSKTDASCPSARRVVRFCASGVTF